MEKFKVAEMFSSINGEGTKAGQLSVFVRFAGCNLNCDYCDTQWANKPDTDYKIMSANEIISKILETGIKNVTITGGEPLYQKGIYEFLELISKEPLSVEIETNGSIDLKHFNNIKNRPSFTMDYKLKSSGMENYMLLSNFDILKKTDTIKFVSGSIEDLQICLNIINKYSLTSKCNIYISPVFGKIAPSDIVDFMLKNKMNYINLQLQLHKYIWDPNKRGV